MPTRGIKTNQEDRQRNKRGSGETRLYYGTLGIFTFVLCCLYKRNTFLQPIPDSLRLRQILGSPPVRARVHAALRARSYGGSGMLGQATRCATGSLGA